MNRRLRITIILFLVVVVSCLTALIFRSREPRCQGRTLAEWLEYGKNTETTDPKFHASSRAVQQMASQAIPFFLKWVKASDSPSRKKIIDWLDENSDLHIKDSQEYLGMAAEGFWLLGGEAKPAWPLLIEWTHSPDSIRRSRAFTCLLASDADRPTLLPVLLRLIHDPDKEIQRNASSWFYSLYPQDAKAAGLKAFNELKDPAATGHGTNEMQDD